MNKIVEISQSQMMLYTGMTSAQLHQAIVQDDANSLQALWYLLSERMIDKLRCCFNIHFGKLEESARQWDDYLIDFFMYVYEYTPSNMFEKVHYYMLRRIEDNTKVESMLLTTFKRYLKEEAETLQKARSERDNVVFEYQFNRLGDVQYNMKLIGYAIALINQREDTLNRYILFRAICNRMMEDYNMIKYPSDEKVAALLNLNYGAYRTRSSRILSQLRYLLHHLTSKDVAELSGASKIMINRLAQGQVGIDTVISRLLKQAENDLPAETVKAIQRLRKKDSHTICEEKTSIVESYITPPQPIGIDSICEIKCNIIAPSPNHDLWSDDFDSPFSSRLLKRQQRLRRLQRHQEDIQRFVRTIETLFL